MSSDFGKYRLLANIGRGGMGEVYLALARGHGGFRKLVVLKTLHAMNVEDEAMRGMFLDEGQLAARLSHQNIVQTYDTGENKGTLYIAMEYLEGQSLARFTRAVPEIDPRLAAHIVADALAGLHYAHQLGDFDGTPLDIVHRDLSPPNIFITYDGVVKLVDFGIAKTAMASRSKTEVGVIKGKMSYMAPEQAMRDNVDRRADLFSLGVVLWELLTGQRLFGGNSPAVTLKRLLHDDIPRVSSVVPGIDPALDQIVAHALERNPDLRYATAAEMRRDLERFVSAGPSVNWEGELAALIGARFGERRRQLQRQIQLCMSPSAEANTRLPTVTMGGSQVGTMSGSSGSFSVTSQTPGGSPVMSGTVDVTEKSDAAKIIAAASWRSKAIALGVALLLLGGAGFAGYVLSGRSQPVVHAPVVAAAAPAPAPAIEVPVQAPPAAPVLAERPVETVVEPSAPVAPARVVAQPPRARPKAPAPSKPPSAVEPARAAAASVPAEPPESAAVSADSAPASEPKNPVKGRAVLVPSASRAKLVD